MDPRTPSPMPEHRIRLRGGWFLIDTEDAEAAPRRLTLPLAGHPAPGRRVVLLRPFQRPPVDPAREMLWLQLDSVPGLDEARLNGVPLSPQTTTPGGLRYCLDDGLPARNRLELHVGTAMPTDGSGWGEVALMIRGRDMPPGVAADRGLQ